MTQIAMYERLRRYIDHTARMSRKEVAIGAGISEAKLSRMLSGQRRITVEEYERLCRAAGISPERLYRE